MLATLALFHAISTGPELAFIGRFYRPGKEKSTYQLFVSSWDGKSRAIYDTPGNLESVRWVGPNHLAVRNEKGILVGELPNWKPKLIPKSKDFYFTESRWVTTGRGTPQVEDLNGNRSFTIQLDPPAIVPLESAEMRKDLSLDENDSTEVRDPDGNWLKLTQYEPVTYKDGGRNFFSDWNFIRGWKSGENLFLIMGDRTSSTGDLNQIALLEKGKLSRMLFPTANAFDFDPESPFYAYCTPRTTSPLGKIQVWTSELHVGNWQTFERRVMLKGVKHIASVSVH
jgi:hypothetical protein